MQECVVSGCRTTFESEDLLDCDSLQMLDLGLLFRIVLPFRPERAGGAGLTANS
jgi:hypothetical protein